MTAGLSGWILDITFKMPHIPYSAAHQNKARQDSPRPSSDKRLKMVSGKNLVHMNPNTKLVKDLDCLLSFMMLHRFYVALLLYN